MNLFIIEDNVSVREQLTQLLLNIPTLKVIGGRRERYPRNPFITVRHSRPRLNPEFRNVVLGTKQ